MVFDFDDFGVNHIISDSCQAHDCRAKLDELHYLNPNFKVTLFAIPFEMTLELLAWCAANAGWVELAVHGLRHTSNYEAEKWTYGDMEFVGNLSIVKKYFTKGFKAPGWQISDEVYKWLLDNGWWVADQSYNNFRRPTGLKAYINQQGKFFAHSGDENVDDNPVQAFHGHTWDCVGNGIYESFDGITALVEHAKKFKFISEVLA